MKSAHYRGDLFHARELLGVLDGIDHPGVPAAGEHYQALVSGVHDNRLVVIEVRVRLPAAVDQSMVERKADFERRGPGDLSGDQQQIVQQKRGTALFDEFDAVLRQPLTIRGWQVHLETVRENEFALQEGVGV